MAVIIRLVFGDTAGLVAGGVTVGGRTMAVGNGSPARFVGFAASLLDLDGAHRCQEFAALNAEVRFNRSSRGDSQTCLATGGATGLIGTLGSSR